MVTVAPEPSTLPPFVVQSYFKVCFGLKFFGVTVALTGSPAQTSDLSTEQLAETGSSSPTPARKTRPAPRRAPFNSSANNGARAVVWAGIPGRQPVPSEQTVNEWLKMLARKTDGGTHHGFVGIVCVTKMAA